MPDRLSVSQLLDGLIKDVYFLNRGSQKNANLCRQYAKRRLAHEGDAFASKILPRFAKHVLFSIERGYITRVSDFSYDTRAAYPRFMKGLLMMIFDESGEVKPRPSASALRLFLQVTQAFSKYEGACGEKVKYGQIEKFVESDELLSPEGWELQEGVKEILSLASDSVARIFDRFSISNLVPRPGSGAEASHKPYCFRFRPGLVPASANKVLDYSIYHYVNDRHLFDAFSTYKGADVVHVLPARLEAVPKTSESWRLICVVANGYMWLQQGLKDLLYDHLERHKMTRGYINFVDQSINGDLAMQASKDGEFATLDMKDASDNITKSHVREVFRHVPWLRDLLLSLSETAISYNDRSGRKKKMWCKKFAPMGSALCFPVMSLLHFVLGTAILKMEGVPPHEREMYVYGDDLICRSKHAEKLLRWFPLLGLKFNPNKCFINSRFRESCGTNALNGVSVTPTRIKKHLSTISEPASLQAYLAYEFDLYSKGFKTTARLLRKHFRSQLTQVGRIKFSAPYITGPNTKILGYKRQYDAARFNARIMYTNKFGTYRAVVWDANYQSARFLSPCTVAKEKKKRVAGWDALLAYLTTGVQSGRRLPIERANTRMTRGWNHQSEFHTLKTSCKEWLPRVIDFLEATALTGCATRGVD